MASVVYYTDSTLPNPIYRFCYETARRACRDHELIAVAQKPSPLFETADVTIVTGPKPRSHRSIYEQIRHGLLSASHDPVFLVEHDVLYPLGFFHFIPPDLKRLWYNRHTYFMNRRGFFPCSDMLLSNCCGSRALLRLAVEQRITILHAGRTMRFAEFGMGFHDSCTTSDWRCEHPAIDIRHGQNSTGMRDSDEVVACIPYWGSHESLRAALQL